MYNEKESNQRMNNIGRNGNDGLHYSLNQENKMNTNEIEVYEQLLVTEIANDLEVERENLITDYMMVAGFSEEEATQAANAALILDNQY